MATDVFISYSRKDKEFTYTLHESLQHSPRQDGKQGEIDCWLDKDDIEYKSLWWERIKHGIEGSNNFVIVLSENYLASEVCNEELAYAAQLKKSIIPILQSPITVQGYQAKLTERQQQGDWTRNPISLADENYKYLNTINQIVAEKLGFEPTVAAVCTALFLDIEYKDGLTNWGNRFLTWERRKNDSRSLLFGSDIDDAEHWIDQAVTKQLAVDESLVNFIRTSRNAQRRSQRIRQVLTSTALIIVGVLALLSIALYVQSENNRVQAVNNAATAVRRADEAQSLSWTYFAQRQNSASDPVTALSLAVEANRIPNPPALAQQTLRELAYAPGPRRQYNTGIGIVVWSEDRKFFLKGGDKGQLSLWDVEQTTPIRQFDGFSGYIDKIAWNPDGHTFLTGDSDDKLFLWDTQQTAPIRQFIRTTTNEYSVAINSVAWSSDGKSFLSVEEEERQTGWDSNVQPFLSDAKIISQTEDDAVHITLWDVEQTTPKRQFMRKGSNPYSSVNNVIWNRDNKTFLTTGNYGEIFLWDVEQITPIRQFVGHNSDDYSRINDAEWSPDGKSFLTVGNSGEVFLWGANREQFVRQFNGHRDIVNHVSWNPDGKTFLTAGSYAEVFQWTIEQTTPLFRYEGHNVEAGVYSIAWSPNGKMFLTGGAGEVFLWRMQQTTPFQRFIGHSTAIDSRINAIAWNSDGKTFFTAEGTGKIFLWDVEPQQPVKLFSTNMLGMYSLTFSPDGQNVIIHGDSDQFGLWDIYSGHQIRQFKGYSGNVVWNRDGKTFLTGTFGGKIFLWDINKYQPIRQYFGETNSVESLEWNADGKTFLTTSDVGEIFLWDVEQSQPIRQFLGHSVRPGSPVTKVVWSADGKSFLSTANDNGEIFLWDAQQSEPIRQFFGHKGYVQNIVWNSDGKTFLTAGDYGQVFLWDVNNKQPIRQFSGHDSNQFNSVASIAWNRDGKTFLTAGGHGEVFLWDVNHEKPIQRFIGHSDTVYRVVWNVDGKTFLTTSGIELFLWQVDQEQPIRKFTENNTLGTIGNIIWNPDGKSFFTTMGSDIYLWHMDNLIDELMQWTLANRVIQPLSCDQRILYGVTPICDAQGTLPVPTPYLTATASPTTTATATINLTEVTVTPTPSITATIPTWTATATLNDATKTAMPLTQTSEAATRTANAPTQVMESGASFGKST